MSYYLKKSGLGAGSSNSKENGLRTDKSNNWSQSQRDSFSEKVWADVSAHNQPNITSK